MTHYQQVEQALAGLEPNERARLLIPLLRDAAGAARGIRKTPGVQGGDACVGRTRIPVWLLEGLRRDGAGDEALLEAYPQLTRGDLANVWTYVALHPEEIERALAEDEAA